MERRSKTVFQLDTPYSEVKWPLITPAAQDTVLELLTSLISPIGQYRARYAAPSRGKRSKKRKRQERQAKSTASEVDLSNDQKPPPPEISPYVVIGAADVLRLLQPGPCKFVTRSKERLVDDTVPKANDWHNLQPLVIFACRSSQPAFLQSQLPQLVGSASLTRASRPMRLVQLPKGCEDRLSSCLGFPRVGILALVGNAPHSKPLMDFVLEHVPVIDSPWMAEVKTARYQPLRVNAIETTAPIDKKKKRPV